MQYAFDDKDLMLIEEVLRQSLIGIGVRCAVFVDMSGAIIAKQDDGQVNHDLVNMAILAACNFSAAGAIAERIGEDDFSLLVHKGKKESIFFHRVTAGFLLMTIFGKEVSVGFLRIGVAETIRKIRYICQQCAVEAEPAINRPSTDRPVTIRPSAIQPTTDLPAADRTAAETPVVNQPVVNQPVVDQLDVELLGVDRPFADFPPPAPSKPKPSFFRRLIRSPGDALRNWLARFASKRRS
jgi:predicted regulator of Ras-like GTPase activity (Roadblock/LC7/MglB family)